MARDLTQKQFDEACERAGFTKGMSFLGYYYVTDTVAVSVLNAGTRRRDQLAYLHTQRAIHKAHEARLRKVKGS